MCIYCECSCQEEFTFDDLSNCSRDNVEFYNVCDICQGEIGSEDETDECDCYNNDDQNYIENGKENCCFCENRIDYDPYRNIERQNSLRSGEYCKSKYGIKSPSIVMEGSNVIQIKNRDENQKRKGSNKKRGMRFCNKEVTCLQRKHKYNITVVPLPTGSKTTEVITKPIRPKPRNLNHVDPKRPKMRIATSRANK